MSTPSRKPRIGFGHQPTTGLCLSRPTLYGGVRVVFTYPVTWHCTFAAAKMPPSPCKSPSTRTFTSDRSFADGATSSCTLSYSFPARRMEMPSFVRGFAANRPRGMTCSIDEATPSSMSREAMPLDRHAALKRM